MIILIDENTYKFRIQDWDLDWVLKINIVWGGPQWMARGACIGNLRAGALWNLFLMMPLHISCCHHSKGKKNQTKKEKKPRWNTHSCTI